MSGLEEQWNMEGLAVVEEESGEDEEEEEEQQEHSGEHGKGNGEYQEEESDWEQEQRMKRMSEATAVPDPSNSSCGEEEEANKAEPEVVADTTDPEPEAEPEPEPPKQRPAKKAQRTKKVDISVTQNAAGKTKQKPQKPATVPAKEEEEEEEEEAGDERSDDVVKAVVQSLVRVAECTLRMCCRLIGGAFSLLRRGAGVLFGTLLFTGMAYLTGTYLMTPVTQYNVPDFDSRLKFLLRYQVWPTLPVFLATMVGTFRKDSKVHVEFAREVFEHALLTLFNFLLLATHLDAEHLIWVGACAITATVFSLLHWMCLVYTKGSGSVFALPATLLNFAVMAYNIYVIFGQDLGYVSMATEPEAVIRSGGSQGNQGWFS